MSAATANTATTSAAFFEAKYRAQPDPWEFATSDYERTRYDRTLSALGDRRFARGFEPGCSVGELTARLAACCESLEAMDISATAVDRARARCRELPNVQLRVGALPQQIPDGHFDLIVLSEIGYYFTEPELQSLAKCLVERIDVGGVLLAVHWLGVSQDHILSGDRVHEVLCAVDGMALDHTERHAQFRLDRWLRV